jgi:hypothetical protein
MNAFKKLTITALTLGMTSAVFAEGMDNPQSHPDFYQEHAELSGFNRSITDMNLLPPTAAGSVKTMNKRNSLSTHPDFYQSHPEIY